MERTLPTQLSQNQSHSLFTIDFYHPVVVRKDTEDLSYPKVGNILIKILKSNPLYRRK